MNPYLSAIGYQGPNTLLAVILLSLAIPLVSPANAAMHATAMHVPFYLFAAVIGWQFISHLINIVIKNTLKYPRPDSKPEEFNKLAETVNWKNYLIIHRNFGMPSGHAQSTVSQLTFIWLYFQNPWLSGLAVVQTAITLWQRYSLKRHSGKQLAAGSLMGLTVGFAFYLIITKKYKA
jgi:membrane-associated phospholipid phosphatase